MQRSAPYLKRPTVRWQECRDSLMQQTLYMVARNGPTVFSIRDELSHTFKVALGNPHSCTCEVGTADLCVHKLFCLIKVLRVPESHPLSYQLGFTDSETEQILSGTCGTGATGATGGSIRSRLRRRGSLRAGDDGNAGSKNNPTTVVDTVQRQVLGDDEEDMCPICQDEMHKEQALTWCRKGCGNNIHAKCMQTYAQFKIVNMQSVCCPLCREDWAIELLRDDVRGKSTLKHSCAPVYCTSCMMSIRSGTFMRCIECSQSQGQIVHMPTPILKSGEQGKSQAQPTIIRKKPVDFCERCFSSANSNSEVSSRPITLVGKEHLMHHFVSSEAAAQTAVDVFWKPATNPISVTSSSACRRLQQQSGLFGVAANRAAPDSLSDQELLSLQERELTYDDYELLLRLDTANSANSGTNLNQRVDLIPHLLQSLETHSPGPQITLRSSGTASLHDGRATLGTDTLRCWCSGGSSSNPSGSRGAEGSSSITEPTKMRLLPCGHVAHDRCISQLLAKEAGTGDSGSSGTGGAGVATATSEMESCFEMGAEIAFVRCGHSSCVTPIFPALNRKRKKRVVAQAAVSTRAAAVPGVAETTPAVLLLQGVGGTNRRLSSASASASATDPAQIPQSSHLSSIFEGIAGMRLGPGSGLGPGSRRPDVPQEGGRGQSAGAALDRRLNAQGVHSLSSSRQQQPPSTTPPSSSALSCEGRPVGSGSGSGSWTSNLLAGGTVSRSRLVERKSDSVSRPVLGGLGVGSEMAKIGIKERVKGKLVGPPRHPVAFPTDALSSALTSTGINDLLVIRQGQDLLREDGHEQEQDRANAAYAYDESNELAAAASAASMSRRRIFEGGTLVEPVTQFHRSSSAGADLLVGGVGSFTEARRSGSTKAPSNNHTNANTASISRRRPVMRSSTANTSDAEIDLNFTLDCTPIGNLRSSIDNGTLSTMRTGTSVAKPTVKGTRHFSPFSTTRRQSENNRRLINSDGPAGGRLDFCLSVSHLETS